MAGRGHKSDWDYLAREAGDPAWSYGSVSWGHQTCTGKMGRDSLPVVEANLKVYGIENLRIADGSIVPRVTTGNTMAPCEIIGELLSFEHAELPCLVAWQLLLDAVLSDDDRSLSGQKGHEVLRGTPNSGQQGQIGQIDP